MPAAAAAALLWIACAATPVRADGPGDGDGSAAPDDAAERIQGWIEQTLEALDEGHERHIDLRRGPLGRARSRSTTGTSWLPETAPSYALLFPVRRWGMMVRGNIFAGYGWTSSHAKGLTSANTLLLSALGDVGSVEVVGRTVLSWEAYTVPQGQPAPFHHEQPGTLDREAPLRLFHELGAVLTWRMNRGLALQGYVAAVGAPALGPPDPSFRPSGFFDPISPLSIDVLESTHSVPGVMTLGVQSLRFMLEGSWFISPFVDPPSYGLQYVRPDAGSVRFSALPMTTLALSVSYGHVYDRLFGEYADRVIASAMWSAPGQQDVGWSVGLVAGINRLGPGQLEPGATAEASWTLPTHHTLYGRLEGLREAGQRWTPDLGGFTSNASVSAGYAYAFQPLEVLAPSLGVRAQCGVRSQSLQSLYPGPVVGGFTAYVELRQVSLPRARGN